ncbi:MAG TPA: STAS domain-containing protein [Tissierellaceae bacterium]|nr:STAS domain-containing protein [Tissierellaceae bacterium]
MSLDINRKFNEKEDLWKFSLIGDLDIYTSNKFKEEVSEALKFKQKDLEIDGSDLDYIDSTGLGVLISILKITNDSKNKIYLKNIQPNVRKIFDITELDKQFTFRGENNG